MRIITCIISIFNKARKGDFIELCKECRISMSDNLTIPSIIELIRNRENYDEKFIKVRLEIILSAILEEKEERKIEEKRK